MIFMNKPAVQEVLREAAASCGYSNILIREQGSAAPAARPAPEAKREPAPAGGSSALDQILANARRLGVDIKQDNKS